MKKLIAILLVLCASYAYAIELEFNGVKAEVYFSPNGGCTQAIVNAYNKATETIYVQAYSLTSAPITTALIAAKNRGVKVVVIADSAQKNDRYSTIKQLYNFDIPVYIDGAHRIAHDKVSLIDNKLVITGSFNYSASAERYNGEQIILIHSVDLARIYANSFAKHLNHSTVYKP